MLCLVLFLAQHSQGVIGPFECSKDFCPDYSCLSLLSFPYVGTILLSFVPVCLVLKTGTSPLQSHLVIVFRQFLSCLRFQCLSIILCLALVFSFPSFGMTLSSRVFFHCSFFTPSTLCFSVMHSSGDTSGISSLLILPLMSFLVWCMQEVGCLWLSGGELMITHCIF